MASAPTTAPPPPSANPALVLVVDDTAINRTVASMLLNQIGYRALAVDGGAAAIEAVAREPIDLVLMDCQMPGMDGYAATARIRRILAPGRHLPILALTAHDRPDDRERCLAAGMDDVLVKPLQAGVLRTTLARWLGSGAKPVPAPAPASEDDSAILDRNPLISFDRLRHGSSAILLGIYLKDLSTAETMLGRALADGDLATVARATHKLKGASLTVGARALAAAMRELERLANEGSLPACQERWRAAATLLVDTRAAIGAYGNGPTSQPDGPKASGRCSPEVLAGQRARALRADGLIAGMEAMPEPAMLLNPERQIVFANGQLLRLLGIADPTTLVGRRPGEVFGCIHAETGPDGCGGAPPCAFCGAMQSVVAGHHDQVRTVKEAHLTIGTETGHGLELELTVTPIQLDAHSYILVATHDIADEKRRKVLERIFLHDVLNSIGGIHGLAVQLAAHQIPSEREDELRQLLAQSTQQLLEEIQAQRQLAEAESGELRIATQTVDLAALLSEIRDACACLPVAAQRSLILGQVAAAQARTDRVLFRRVLINLVKNALEATPPGGTVTIGSRLEAGRLRCTVHNPGTMPPEVQLQLFQRSFSTKGVDRGLGTWSAKLLGERYLGGRISFTSAEPAGTELAFTLPLDPP